MMQSIVWTGRLLSRALWNGISNYSNCAEPNVNRRHESRIVSAVCGFPKELAHARLKKGQFGDDAWFTAKYKSADVIGKCNNFATRYVCCLKPFKDRHYFICRLL
jgi:protein phosphatase PTC7